MSSEVILRGAHENSRYRFFRDKEGKIIRKEIIQPMDFDSRKRQVLCIVYRAIAGFLIKHAGHKRKTATTGAVTVIQRFGSALNLNIHFHMLLPDGVFVKIPGNNALFFKKLPKLSQSQIQGLTERIAHRVIRYLEKQGIIERGQNMQEEIAL